MRFNTKCLRTFTFTTFLSILTNNLCECKSSYADLEDSSDIYDNFNSPSSLDIAKEKLNQDVTAKISSGEKRGWDSNFAVWGKRNYENIPENESDQDLTTTQHNTDKRKWSKFVSWGKRELPLDTHKEWIDDNVSNKRDLEEMSEPLNTDDSAWVNLDTDKRKWQALSTWGKRSEDNSLKEDSKRGWSRFTSWGKRDSEPNFEEMDKRKWQKFTSWGKRDDDLQSDAVDKRKWAKFASWGKRNIEPISGQIDKRKWAKFASWGKRSDLDNALEAAKRKWAKFTSWGKRDGFENDGTVDMPNETNQMDVWGKGDDKDTEFVDKRNWAKFTSWGKRPRNPKAWLALNTWGKRRWTGLTTWGKRSGDGFETEILARKLLRFFDLNGDGALDIAELNNYIRTLMSLPSKLDAEDTLSTIE